MSVHMCSACQLGLYNVNATYNQLSALLVEIAVPCITGSLMVACSHYNGYPLKLLALGQVQACKAPNRRPLVANAQSHGAACSRKMERVSMISMGSTCPENASQMSWWCTLTYRLGVFGWPLYAYPWLRTALTRGYGYH